MVPNPALSPTLSGSLLLVLSLLVGPVFAADPTLTEAGNQADDYAALERQIELNEYTPAIQELEQQIQALESTKHRYHEDLVRPLLLLGDAKQGAQDYPGALDAYGRAVHLMRVTSGLHSEAQVAGVYREAKVYKAVGDLKQANDREEYAWQVLQKTHGRYSPKLLPGIKHLADWYGQTYNVLAARGLYMRAVRIVEANYDEQHPEMVNALRGLAKTYRQERFPDIYLNNATTDLSTVTPRNSLQENNSAILLNRFPQGEKALKRIVRIQQAKLAKLEPQIVNAVALSEELEEETPEKKADQENADPENADPDAQPSEPTTAPVLSSDPVAIALARQKLIAALVELGDWFLLFEKSRVAMQYYAQAEAINAKLGPEFTALDFTRPQLLHFPAPGDPPSPKARYRGERKQGYVELSYNINVRGAVANLKTLDSSPKGLMDYRVRKSMLASRYRPPFINGAPVATEGHSYRHTFNYYPNTPDPAKDTPASDGAPDKPATNVGVGDETPAAAASE